MTNFKLPILFASIALSLFGKSLAAGPGHSELDQANRPSLIVLSANANSVITIWKDLKLGKQGIFFNDIHSLIFEESEKFITVHLAMKGTDPNLPRNGGATYKLAKNGKSILSFQLTR